MAGLITVDTLRDEFPFVIQPDIGDPRLGRSLISASKRLKSWIGAEVYDTVVADIAALAEEDPEEPVVVDEERISILQNAEGHLALHYLLLGLNTNLGPNGLVKREQVEGNTTNEYFSPGDVANFMSQFLEMAREIADPYALADGTPTATFEVAV